MSLEYTRVNLPNLSGMDQNITTTSALQTKVAEIRQIRVNWQSYLQGQMITEEHFTFITRLDNAVNPAAREFIIRENTAFTAKVLINMLNKISKEQTVQYLLTVLDDLLQEDKTRVEIFRDYFAKRKESVFSHFFGFLQRSDQLSVYQASRVVAKLACWSTQLMEKNDLLFYLNWLREQLKVTQNEFVETAARNLQMILRVYEYRQTFIADGGLETIVEVLANSAASRQLQYQLIFCLWCLSFDAENVPVLIRGSSHLIPTVADIFREAEREKITRICLALFRFLLEKLTSPTDLRDCALSMVQCKVLKQLKLLGQKDFSHDPEITEDMAFLEEKLSTSVTDVSSLDEYCVELRSGRLEWSPVHKSEKFWRENAVKFTDNNYELLKMLIRLMEVSSTSPLIMSVAAHDIGEFVRHYPRGKQVLEQLGGKHMVMNLLQHEDPNVWYNALVALQKIMVHNWEYLGKQLDSAKGDDMKAGGPRAK